MTYGHPSGRSRGITFSGRWPLVQRASHIRPQEAGQHNAKSGRTEMSAKSIVYCIELRITMTGRGLQALRYVVNFSKYRRCLGACIGWGASQFQVVDAPQWASPRDLRLHRGSSSDLIHGQTIEPRPRRRGQPRLSSRAPRGGHVSGSLIDGPPRLA